MTAVHYSVAVTSEFVKKAEETARQLAEYKMVANSLDDSLVRKTKQCDELKEDFDTLYKELEWTRSELDRLTLENQELHFENKRLKNLLNLTEKSE